MNVAFDLDYCVNYYKVRFKAIINNHLNNGDRCCVITAQVSEHPHQITRLGISRDKLFGWFVRPRKENPAMFKRRICIEQKIDILYEDCELNNLNRAENINTEGLLILMPYIPKEVREKYRHAEDS